MLNLHRSIVQSNGSVRLCRYHSISSYVYSLWIFNNALWTVCPQFLLGSSQQISIEGLELWFSDAICRQRTGSTCVQYWLVTKPMLTLQLRFCGIHLRTISQKVLKNSFCDMTKKITLHETFPFLPGANELIFIRSTWSFPHRWKISRVILSLKEGHPQNAFVPLQLTCSFRLLKQDLIWRTAIHRIPSWK